MDNLFLFVYIVGDSKVEKAQKGSKLKAQGSKEGL